MKISLEINGVSLELESHVDQSQLSDAGFEKVGFFTRLFLPFPKKTGDSIFSSKNPRITLFCNTVQAVANVDVSMDADMMNGTTCFAIVNGDRLRHIICQVTQNNTAANQFTKDVRHAALNELGDAVITGGLATWKEGRQTFKSIIDSSGNNAYIHWISE